MNLDLLTIFALVYAVLVFVGLSTYSTVVLIRTGSINQAAQSCLRLGVLYLALGALFLPILTLVLQRWS
jgi:hypothetical protein